MILWEPYYFKTPEDIVHHIAETCIMTVCDCKKGYCHQQLVELHHFYQHLIQNFRFGYTVMSFGATVAGDVFQCKLDQCFGKIKQVIVIADDIMIVGKKQNHSGHDQCNTVKSSLTAPRYTGVIPATYAGPGQLGSEGLPHGKCAWGLCRG